MKKKRIKIQITEYCSPRTNPVQFFPWFDEIDSTVLRMMCRMFITLHMTSVFAMDS